MRYSEHLATQAAYDITSREFLPPFQLVLVIALSLHVAGLLLWSLWPSALPDPPAVALSLTLGTTNTPDPTAHTTGATLGNVFDEMLLTAPTRTPPRHAGRTRPHTPSASAASAAPTERHATTPSGAEQAGGHEASMRRYEQLLSRWIARHKIYPREAQRWGMTGRVILRLRIDRAGYVKRTHIEHSAGHELLDLAVLESMRRANPVPAPPESYPGGRLLEFRIPVDFSLEE